MQETEFRRMAGIKKTGVIDGILYALGYAEKG
jgi:hypothetical protein